eukprot:882392-Amphidinium_carterae.1
MRYSERLVASARTAGVLPMPDLKSESHIGQFVAKLDTCKCHHPLRSKDASIMVLRDDTMSLSPKLYYCSNSRLVTKDAFHVNSAQYSCKSYWDIRKDF